MVTEIEKKGIPVAHMVNMVPVAQSIGSTRIIKTVAIPHPLGDPALSPEAQYELRYKLVAKALHTLEENLTEQLVYE